MKADLIVPIYVDTNALLDLLASIEGGFSLVEKVTSYSILGAAYRPQPRPARAEERQ